MQPVISINNYIGGKVDCQCTFIAHSIINHLDLILFIIEGPRDQAIEWYRKKEGRKEGRNEGRKEERKVCICVHACIQ